ncbi:MAG: cyclic nucleotide-binding domain-containing protein [Verrucomicrobia bacterium]|nr:cyclic nucleotide-binding domain-containing protein [Verrucomicrobiota bacterium]
MSDPHANATLPVAGITANFGVEARAALSGYGEFISVEPTHNLVEEGAELGRMYILVSGELSVRRQGQSSELELAKLQPGDTFGEISIFDPGPTSATICPTQPSLVWTISWPQLEFLMNNNHQLGGMLLIGLATILSRRLREMNKKLVTAARV